MSLAAAIPLYANSRTLEFAKDPLTNPGFVHFYNLEFDQAVADFEREVSAHPNEPDGYNHLALGVLYREMLRDGALDSQLVTGSNPFLRRPKMQISPEDKRRFMDSVNRSLELCEAMLEKNPRDIHALYACGVAHGLRANYLFLVEKAWIDSLRDATADRKANESILEIDPNFVDAQFVVGLYRYVVGNLPFLMRALGFLGGFHGDKEAGISQLQEVAAKGILTRYDAQAFLTVIYRRERHPAKALPVLQELAEKFPRNYLFRFEEAEMYGDLGNKNSALQIVAEIEDLRRTGAPGYANIPVEKIQYLRGNLLFWYGDLNPALADLKRITEQPDQVDLGTAVLAWLRVGQIYDLKGNREEAIEAYRETVKAAPGSQAANEAKNYMSNRYRRKDR